MSCEDHFHVTHFCPKCDRRGFCETVTGLMGPYAVEHHCRVCVMEASPECFVEHPDEVRHMYALSELDNSRSCRFICWYADEAPKLYEGIAESYDEDEAEHRQASNFIADIAKVLRLLELVAANEGP